MTTILDLLNQANSVIPVVVLDHANDATPLANALARGGFKVIEITLRTDAATDSISALRDRTDVVVGAGTVWTGAQADACIDAGARFVVSPGFSDAVHEVTQDRGVAYLPGVATPTEAWRAAELGYRAVKAFPADVIGGPSLVKSLGSVLPELAICPTGGIGPNNLDGYLALPNVACVGGSWLVPRAQIQSGDWAEIDRRIAQAAAQVATQ